MDVTAQAAIKPVIPVKTKPVTINGVTIDREAIGREVQHHPAGKPGEAWAAAARALAIRELLLQEALRLRLTPTPLTDADGRREMDEEALVRCLVEQEVKTPTPDIAACRRYYDQNLGRFRSSDLYEVAHILIGVTAGSSSARLEARQQCEALIARLLQQPEQFAELALLHSMCPSRTVGGNLGQIGPGQTVPEFESAVASLPIGKVHALPVESRYGFHVVRVERHEAGKQLPFDMVHERIASYLGEHVRRTAIRQYISLLAGRASITGVDLAASESPLVQ